MNSTPPPAPKRVTTLTRPIRPMQVHTATNEHRLVEYLPKNAYNLDLRSTRQLVVDLSNKMQILHEKMMKMRELHETADLERQMQMYAMRLSCK